MNSAEARRPARGALITFEGTEGCGKSTQVRMLAARLAALGREVVEVREPGGTPLGEEIRHTLKHSPAGRGMCAEAELLLMNAARAQLVREVIRPALERGAIILCDRFYDSTVAYQGWGRGLDPAWVTRIIEFAVGPTRPALTLLFEVTPEVSASRRRARGTVLGSKPGDPDRFESEATAFFDRVADGFRALAIADPDRVRVVNADGTPEAVHELVWREVVLRMDIGSRDGSR